MTYKTYQEAKIDNPEKEIWTNGTKFSNIQEGSVWFQCNPDDYCMTVEQFLKGGYKLATGDLYIEINGDVESVGLSDIDGINTMLEHDASRYVLRAAALEEFTKEDRYLVIKRKDIRKYLDNDETKALYRLADTVASGREAAGKIPLECVVVESDWTIYPKVWEMIEGKSMEKQPVITKDEYVKVDFDYSWQAVKEVQDGFALYFKGNGDKYVELSSDVAIINMYRRANLYRKVEKPATWQDITCDFFNEYPIVLDTVESIKAAINQVCITDKDKPTVLQREFIKMCHTVASMTDNPE